MYIKGDSLVLMDGETFAEISKMLMFKNKKKNVFDSISVNVVVNDVNGNLAVSNIRKLECSSFDFHSIAYGYGTFKEKIHFTEYYP